MCASVCVDSLSTAYVTLVCVYDVCLRVLPCPRDAWERAEAEATKERESHERLVNDFQMLLDQKSKAQTDRMRELTWRLDELSSAADVAGPRGTSTSSRDVTSDGRHLHTGREGGKGGLFSAHGSEQEEKEFHPPQGFSFADEVATGVNKETVDALVDDPHGGGTRSDHATDCGGWEGDVMYEGGSEGVVAWGALSQGEEDRRLRAAKDALGAVTKKAGTGSGSGSVTGSVTVTEGSTQSSRGGGGGGRGGSGRGLGVGGPDGMKIVLTKSGGYSGVAPGPGLGRGRGRGRGLGHKGGGSYGCLTEHSGSAIVPLDDGKKTNVM